MPNNYQFKPSILPERFKIKYEFIRNKFVYLLPLTGVDIEFLSVRRREIYLCIEMLAKSISQINIANRGGMDDMETAAHLLRWYHDALRHLNIAAYMLNNPSYSKEYMLDTEAKLWIEASKEKTI